MTYSGPLPSPSRHFESNWRKCRVARLLGSLGSLTWGAKPWTKENSTYWHSKPGARTTSGRPRLSGTFAATARC
jgi:hypothetical protein